MGNSVVRTGRSTASALLTLLGINMGTVASCLDGTKLTGIDTCLTHTVLTVLCNGIAGNRTVLAGCTDDLNDISIILRSRSLALCKANTLADNLSLLIDTAAELWCRSRNQMNRNVVPL